MPWPKDMVSALQGVWLSERDLEAFEIRGNDIFLKSRSQYGNGGGTFKNVPEGAKIGTVTNEVLRLEEPHHIGLNGACYQQDAGLRDCRGLWVNRAEPGWKWAIVLWGNRFEREKEMSGATKKYRAEIR
ncbi:MAG: hypothetical protein JWQ29_2549 [Phenylobacterium sp.]|nr:hypothetical protein [Phenylobacterium sp.]